MSAQETGVALPRGSRILLHVCCAPCSTSCIKTLQEIGLVPVLFFSNSNIHPRDEYDRRLAEAKRLAAIEGLDLVEDEYDHGSWLEAVRGLEDEPERGRRCIRCFAFNLGRCEQASLSLGLPWFTTTLTVSRHKSSSDILAAGKALNGFVFFDFKKKGGDARSVELSRRLGLYRQGYCGCEFSMRRLSG